MRASDPNLRCEMCQADLTGKDRYDAATTSGPWAWMCRKCFIKFGVGIGPGRGQQFDKTGKKIAG